MAGVVWQWPSEDRGNVVQADHGQAAESRWRRGDGATNSIERSQRSRRVSERKAHFAFETISPGSLKSSFLRDEADVEAAVAERREAVEERQALDEGGLGRKHPDLLALDQKIKEIEEFVLDRWSGYRSRREGERISARGRY